MFRQDQKKPSPQHFQRLVAEFRLLNESRFRTATLSRLRNPRRTETADLQTLCQEALRKWKRVELRTYRVEE